MSRSGTWIKMGVAAVGLCVGGPALVWYVTPTEEELFKRYNPDLQRRSLENRVKNQEEFDHFVTRLKEYSKSDKPIWEAQAEAVRREAEERQERLRRENQSIAQEMRKQQEAVRKSAP